MEYGECKPGIKTCYNGQNTDVSPITPQDEVCDGLDNNCNGFVDEDNNKPPKAFLIVLDVSGSMSDNIDTIKQTICAFSQTNISNNSLFAIIEVSIGYSAPYIFLAQDFSSSQETCDLMNTQGFGEVNGGLSFEYMLQGMLLSSNITWPSNMDRKVIAFTDEEKQLYLNTDEDNVLIQCQDNNYEIGIFTLSTFFDQWNNVVNTCGGYEDVLTNDVQEMKQSLITHYFGICQ